MKSNICHIGFPKTGTTYLQSHIFNQIEGIKFFNKDLVGDLFNQIIDDDDSILKATFIKEQFDKLFDNSNINLCSYEPLTGQHYHSGFINRSIIAKRLKALGFQKIIICIRNQYDMIVSTYKQYIKSGGVLKFDEYFDFKQIQKRPYFRLTYYDYHHCYKLYSSIFGKENVLIIQYEQINSPFYFEHIFNFIGLPIQHINTQFSANISLSKSKTDLMRIINHFTYNAFQPNHLISNKFSSHNFYRLFKKLPLLNGSGSYLNITHLEIIKNLYAKGNLMLEKDFGLVLNKKYPK